jgi:hypothetical protein
MLGLGVDTATNCRRQAREGLNLDVEGLRRRRGVPHSHGTTAHQDRRVQPAAGVAIDHPPVMRRRYQLAILPAQQVLVPPRDEPDDAGGCLGRRSSQ